MMNKIQQAFDDQGFYNETELNLNVFTIYKGKKSIEGWSKTYPCYTIHLYDGGLGYTRVFLENLEEAIDTCLNHSSKFEKVKRLKELEKEVAKEWTKRGWSLD